jgi:protein subunit release factor A
LADGPKPVSYRQQVELPVGFEDPVSGALSRDAEVRAVSGGDEMAIGMSTQYNKYANDLIYKTLLLSRCVTRLGDRTNITLSDVQRLHAQDMRVLEYEIYKLTYGEHAVPEPDGPSG